MTTDPTTSAAQDGLNHLQAAAREMIAAARAFLDAAEAVVEDPQQVTQAVGVVGSFVKAASAAVQPTARDADGDPIERITVT